MTRRFERLRRLVEPSALIRLVGAVGSQFNNSLINFALVIFASRVLPPAEFGVFALIITFFYAVQAVIEALLIAPASAYRSDNAATRKSYAGSLVLLLAMLLAALLPLALAGIVIVELEGLFVAVALVFVVFSIGESARKLGALFCEPKIVAMVEGARIVLVATLFAVAAWLHLATGASIIEVFGLLGAIQAILFIYVLALYTRPRRKLLAPIAVRHWEAGRWYMVSVLFYLGFDVPATFYASTLFGVEYAGYLRIGFAFFAPFNAVISVAELWLAQVFARSEALRDRLWTIFIAVLALSATLAAILFTISEWLLLTAFGPNYLSAQPALAAYIVIAVLALSRCIISAYLKSENRAREFLFVVAAGASVAAVGSLVLGLSLGFVGVLAGMILGHFVSSCVAILVVLRGQRNGARREAGAAI